jgi:hypothetical protein
VIAYREGYVYQLAETYTVQISIKPPKLVRTPWIRLTTSGRLTVKASYAWDGPSGPAMDTKSAMRGSLCHDVLYQLLRLGLLPPESRKEADRIYRQMCEEDGMLGIRAAFHFTALRWFGGSASEPESEPEILYAP